MRSPRLTRASDGKPLLRLLVELKAVWMLTLVLHGFAPRWQIAMNCGCACTSLSGWLLCALGISLCVLCGQVSADRPPTSHAARFRTAVGFRRDDERWIHALGGDRPESNRHQRIH